MTLENAHIASRDRVRDLRPARLLTAPRLIHIITCIIYGGGGHVNLVASARSIHPSLAIQNAVSARRLVRWEMARRARWSKSHIC